MNDGLCSSMDRMNDKPSTVTLAHAPRVNYSRLVIVADLVQYTTHNENGLAGDSPNHPSN